MGVSQGECPFNLNKGSFPLFRKGNSQGECPFILKKEFLKAINLQFEEDAIGFNN